MSSFLDSEYEWQHRPDETTVSPINQISSTTSDGILPLSVGSCSYGITSDSNGEGNVSHAVAAVATTDATATATATAIIKSEQAMLLDDDETADDDNDTAGSRYKNYYDYDDDDDFDSSDDEAIIARTKMATKKKKKKKETHHASDATTSDGNGNSTLRGELVTNINNGVPMTTLTRTASNTSNEMMDKYSSTSCLLLNCKDDGTVAAISRDDDDDHVCDDDIGDDHGDDDSTFQRSEGIKRKRHEKNPGNNTDSSGNINSNSNGNSNSDSKDNGSDNNVYSAKRIRVEVDRDILFPSSLPVMSNSRQAVQDVRFCNNEVDCGGAVSVTASSEQRFDSNPVLRPRNAKSTKSTNSIASDGSFHENIPKGHAKPSSKNSTKWEGKCQQLADFKVKFLHMNVPAKHAENKPLASWVDTQRKQYKLFKEKRKSSMTRERIQSLDKLDFEWERSTTRTWEESRQQLVNFKRKFRHTNVPQKFIENRPLGRWVHKQRRQYKLFKTKRKSHMTRERIQSLEELDFEWECNTTRTWEKSRQQLVDFKNKFRHTNVPQTYAENKPLGNWVNTQRTQYRFFKAKRESHMTRERIQSLDELDFEWQLRTRSNTSSLVEKSTLSTEGGYESDNSELYLIV